MILPSGIPDSDGGLVPIVKILYLDAIRSEMGIPAMAQYSG